MACAGKNRSRLPGVAQPARYDEDLDETPPVDPDAIHRAYRFHRAKRFARIERRRERQHARLRFWAFFGLLILGVLVLLVTVWHEIRQLFGL